MMTALMMMATACVAGSLVVFGVSNAWGRRGGRGGRCGRKG